MTTLAAKIQLRRDTAAGWADSNPVLLDGELGFETDTLQAKLGDGATRWNALPYIIDVRAVPTKTSDLTNDSGFITSAAVPTKTSDLTNDSGFLTQHQSLAGYVPTSRKVNNKALTGDVSLAAGDVGAVPAASFPASTGTATKGIYIDASGKAAAMTYELNKTVPSDAKFTDTTYSAATSAPKSAGTAAVGTSAKYAREDHVHPLQTAVSGNAGTATKLAATKTVDGVAFDGSGNIHHYTTCSTAAATAAKTADLTGFTLATGAEVNVKFTVTNTAANPTLNVNGTGAKAIQYRGAAITAGYLAANRTYRFVYDGTAYQLVGDINTDTNNATAQNISTANSTYPILLGNTANATANIGNKAALFGAGIKANPSTSEVIASKFTGNLTGNVTGDVSGNAGTVNGHTVAKDVPSNAVFTDTNNKVAVTELSTDSDNYSNRNVLIKSGNLNTNVTDGMWWNRGFQCWERKGTESRQGGFYLGLGNNIASGTANNLKGFLRLYSAKANYGDIVQADITANVTHTMPATGGTVLNTGTTALSNAATSGKKVADLKLNGTTTSLYAPPPDTMGAASASAAGTAGLVPAPAAGKQGQYLRGDGTWNTPTNTSPGASGTATFATAKGTAPGSNQYHEHISYDNTGNGSGAAYRFALVGRRLTTGNEAGAYIQAYDPTSAATREAHIGVYYPAGGTAYTYAPTPAQTDSSTKIATTAYVKACVPKSVGSSSVPVYSNANGVITACSISASAVGAVGKDNGSVAVGSYVLAGVISGGTAVSNGGTCAGSNLSFLSFTADYPVLSGTPSGTFRNVSGKKLEPFVTTYAASHGGIFQRIS